MDLPSLISALTCSQRRKFEHAQLEPGDGHVRAAAETDQLPRPQPVPQPHQPGYPSGWPAATTTTTTRAG